MRMHTLTLALLLGTGMALPASAADGEECGLAEALGSGTLTLKQRYRLETVDQDNALDDAFGITMGSELGYETGTFHDFFAMVEFEDTTPLGQDTFNSTTNGRTRFSVIADPNSTEVNQLLVGYTGVEHWTFRAGRQRFVLDNHRFVGDVDWRQNQQTFDAMTATGDVGGFGVFYGYVDNVNRINGDDHPLGDTRMKSHLLNVGRDIGDLGKATAYLYRLDYDTANAFSSQTLGARLEGSRAVKVSERDLKLLYLGELAYQIDAGDNPANYDELYYHLMVGGSMRNVTVKLGFESLGGSGDPGEAFQTPLATLHAHNGWADMFLVTPDTGLEDAYLSAGYQWNDLKLMAVYHDFSSDSGGLDYGTEWGFLATYPICEAVDVGFKYASYDRDDSLVDTDKAWLWLQWQVKLAVNRKEG